MDTFSYIHMAIRELKKPRIFLDFITKRNNKKLLDSIEKRFLANYRNIDMRKTNIYEQVDESIAILRNIEDMFNISMNMCGMFSMTKLSDTLCIHRSCMILFPLYVKHNPINYTKLFVYMDKENNMMELRYETEEDEIVVELFKDKPFSYVNNMEFTSRYIIRELNAALANVMKNVMDYLYAEYT